MVEDAVDILAERAHGKGLELICDIPAQIDMVVSGDGHRLRQVIVNLISKVVKFTERGEIKVTVRHAGADLLNSAFHFEVADTGIGIKPEKCAAIFESFAQGDVSTLHRPGGPNLLAKVVGLYVESSLVLTDAMRKAGLSRDAPGVRQAAHALKSSSANVGAMGLAELCKDVEVAAAEEKIDYARSLVDRVLAQHKQVLEALDAQNMAA